MTAQRPQESNTMQIFTVYLVPLCICDAFKEQLSNVNMFMFPQTDTFTVSMISSQAG